MLSFPSCERLAASANSANETCMLVTYCMVAPPRLVLFDIDGTLLTAAGAGKRAIHRALRDVFGGIGPADYWFDGKTDPQIVRDLMRHEGHSDAVIDERLSDVLA